MVYSQQMFVKMNQSAPLCLQILQISKIPEGPLAGIDFIPPSPTPVPTLPTGLFL